MKIKDILLEDDFVFAVSKFLENFYADQNQRDSLISEKPVSNNCSSQNFALLAAIAHKLANDFDLIVPSWVFDKEFFLEAPHYQFETKNVDYQAYLRNNSPAEFASRNLFFDNNALSRC